MKIQRVANMSVVLAFLRSDVKISNIGVLDIVEGKLKCLGFVWSIVAFYLVRDIGGGEDDVAAVRRVLRWARRQCGRRAPISDLTKSFKDGKAFLAILNDVDVGVALRACKPVGKSSTRVSDAEQNMASTRCWSHRGRWRDEISMLTYLASMMEAARGVEQRDTGVRRCVARLVRMKLGRD